MNGSEEIIKAILEQTPEVYEQTVQWGIVNNWIGIGLLVLAVFCAAGLVVNTKKECEPIKAVCVSIGVFSLIIAVACQTLFPLELKKIEIAPKLYVLEHLIKQVK